MPQWPQPYPKRRRTIIHSGSNTAIAGQADNGLPPVHWQLPTNQPPKGIKPRRFNYPVSVSDQLFNVPTTTPAVTGIFIGGQSPDPIWRQSFQYEDLVTIDAAFHLVPSAPVAFPAVWQNLAAVTLNAADLASVTLLIENLGDDGDVMFESDSDVLLITEDTDSAAIIYEDTDSASIKYEDTDTV